MELLDNKHIPKEVFHWGYEYLDTTQEEQEKYWRVCDVVDSEFVYKSEKIYNSKTIADSKEVTNSTKISNGRTIEDSESVSDSSFVHRSQNIYGSKKVVDCADVCNSNDVFGSRNILNSNIIQNSRHIVRSANIDSCSVLYNCHSTIQSLFSSYLNDSAQCIFCSGLDHGYRMLFNKPIEVGLLDRIGEEFFDKVLNEEFKLMSFNESSTFLSLTNPPSEDIRTYFEKVTPEFWEWVKQLPNFDPFVMYNITFMPMWLDM